jgi:hypothetical protein
MKHFVRVFLFTLLLAVCLGCASTGAEISYEELFLRDAVQIIDWFDEAQFVETATRHSDETAFAFWAAYPNEKEIESMVRSATDTSLNIIGETITINIAIRSYMRTHNAYIENKTTALGKALYQNLVDITADIKRWYSLCLEWDSTFKHLDSMMQRYDFHYVAP